ncbi:MAG: hypothetical protein R6U55_07500 [Desulfovermiculus sp.]
MYVRRMFITIAALMLILGVAAQSSWAVQEEPAQKQALEQAVGPKAFLSLEGEGKLTVRALRAWNRLSPEFMDLASSLRREQGLDLLSADLETIQAWSAQAAQGEKGLSAHGQALRELAAYMQSGEYLDWEAVADPEQVPEGTLLRQGQKRWLHTKESKQTGAQTAPPSEAERAPIGVLDASEAETASKVEKLGSKQGLEFRISDQTQGTFQASLRLEGLDEARIEDDRYFQVMAAQALPDSPQVQDLEQKELTPNAKNWTSDRPYQNRAGYARIGQRIAVRVEAPKKPKIVMPDKEAEAGFSYEIVGRKFKVVVSDQAYGDAKVDLEKDWNGEHGGGAAWIPLVDEETGRPVGPRAVGVYMAYRVKKFGPNKSFMGELHHDFRRIGWVLIGMPGDLYADEANIYAVGEKEPLAGKDAQSNWDWPAAAAESMDFTLPQKAVDRAAVRFSMDMRHAAWIEEDPEKGKRVVLNGRPGRWYDDIFRYMKFSEQGELFGFRADLGQWELAVINGSEGPVFEDIRRFEITRDGAHNMVAGRVRKGLEQVIVDGHVVGETAGEIKEAVLAPDGTAAWVEESADSGLVRMMSTKGDTHPEYTVIYSPEFSVQGSVLAYIGKKENKQRFLVVNGREVQPTMGVGSKYTLTPDGAHYAYVAPNADNTESMVIDGRVGPAYKGIWNPARMSRDGSRSLYVAKTENGAVLVIDEQELEHSYGPVNSFSSLTLSPDGAKWAVALEPENGEEDEYILMVNGKEFAQRTGLARQITFSPDSSRTAWVEKREKLWRVVVDGEEGPQYRDIFRDEPLQFTPAGESVVYFTQNKDKKMSIAVFDGTERTHDVVIPLVRFPDQGITYLAIDGTRLQRFSLQGE